MKPYTYMRKKLEATEVTMAVGLIVGTKKASITMLQRNLQWGPGLATIVMQVLVDAKVVGTTDGTKPRAIYLKTRDAAINAALRQLKKGRR